MTRRGRAIFAVVAVQAALAAAYWLVERGRASSDAVKPALGTEPPVSTDLESASLERLSLTSRERGRIASAVDPGRTTLVHFWATWCPPCRAELPALLKLPERHEVDVVAVALDRDWSSIERFFGGRPPPSIVLGDSGEVGRVLGITVLPVTLLVTAAGHVRWRIDGARDWSDDSFVDAWVGNADRSVSHPPSSEVGSPR